jgi:hypothetical protein
MAQLRNSMSKLTVDSIVVKCRAPSTIPTYSRAWNKTASQGIPLPVVHDVSLAPLMIAAGDIYGDSAAAK